MLRCCSRDNLSANQYLSDPLFVLEDTHVEQRIAGNDDEVGKLSRLDRTDIPLHAEALSGNSGGGADRLKRGEATFDQLLQLTGAFAMSDHKSCVRARSDLNAGLFSSPQRLPLVLIDLEQPLPFLLSDG